MINCKFTKTGKSFQVATPFHPDFAALAKRKGATWDADLTAWSFNSRDEKAARNLTLAFFGFDGLSDPDLVDVQVEIGEYDYRDMNTLCRPFSLFGRILAEATSRDSGARLGEEVSLRTGDVRSGGSAKNWETKIDDGAVFIVRDVPRCRVESEINELNEEIKIELIGTGEPDKAFLLAAKAELESRLAIINKTLNTL